mgnify:CR=1 FL=1
MKIENSGHIWFIEMKGFCIKYNREQKQVCDYLRQNIFFIPRGGNWLLLPQDTKCMISC